MIHQIQNAVEKRELIKVTFIANTLERNHKKLPRTIAEATGSTIIQVIGHTIVLYKEARNPKHRDLSVRFAEFKKRGR